MAQDIYDYVEGIIKRDDVMTQLVRQPAVAGAFYPGSRDILYTEVNSLLETAGVQKTAEDPAIGSTPKAIIVPHAGYIYSGAVAATAYSRLHNARDIIKRVVLLGPCHRVPVRGLALPGVDIFETPLGQIPVDQHAVTSIRNLSQVVESPAVHADEHSLEVQLPFLQSVLSNFSLLPLAVGDATSQEVAEVLEVLWGGDETLIVVSSDLSHFLPYQDAQHIDKQTVQEIIELRGPLDHQQACGGTPVNGLLLAARHHHLQPELLDLRNSGDTAGDKSRVVGYASVAFNERDD
jgi:AmmeMemoRadiSam system protein B